MKTKVSLKHVCDESGKVSIRVLLNIISNQEAKDSTEETEEIHCSDMKSNFSADHP